MYNCSMTSLGIIYVSLESELSLFLDKFCQAEKAKWDGSSNIHRSGLSGVEPLVKVGELLFWTLLQEIERERELRYY